MVALILAVVVIIFMSLFIGAAYGHYLRTQKGESNSAVELGIKNACSSSCILILIVVLFMWPASFAWYKQQPIAIFYNLVSKNLKPADKNGGLLPAQKYANRADRDAAANTYKYLHLLLTAALTSAFVGICAGAISLQAAEVFFPSGGRGGGGGGKGKGNAKSPRSPFTNRPI